MADYTLDRMLYDQALEEIRQDFLSKNPMTPRVTETMAPAVAQHAESCFSTVWHTAVGMHERHRAFCASQMQMDLDPVDSARLAGLLPKDRERFVQMHEENQQEFKASMERRQKISDELHRATLIATIAGAGMTRATAEKVVDIHILVH